MKRFMLSVLILCAATACMSQTTYKRTDTDTTNLSARINLKRNLSDETFSGPALGTPSAYSFTMNLHATVAGDSVFGKMFLRTADTCLVMWNGTAWITIKDMAP